MPQFSKASLDKLNTCHPDIQRVLKEAIKYVDFTVTCGHRTKEEQDECIKEGTSETPWPTSKHNSIPSMAVDVAPYSNGILWDDAEGFTLLSGIIKGIALTMGVNLRVGIDWDGDLVVKEHSFKDRPHLELKGS